MGFTYVKAIFVLVGASMLAATLAKKVVVGGSEGWRYGYNYTDWALKHGPFYINDTLVFKSGTPPSKETSNDQQRHSVYLLPNLYSFATCDFSEAKLLSSELAGGDAFSYVLNQWRPHYFASGEGDGDDCEQGMMKFFAVPLPRWFH